MIHPAVDDMIVYLNEVLKLDPVAVTAMIERRVPCNAALAKHPTVQVTDADAVRRQVGVLGLLNGFFGVFDDGLKKGWGAITANYNDAGQITHFSRTVNEPEPEPPEA